MYEHVLIVIDCCDRDIFLQAFLQDIPTYEQKHAVLNELGHNLATRYHADDSTTDLQDVLKDINQRWTAVMERYMYIQCMNVLPAVHVCLATHCWAH